MDDVHLALFRCFRGLQLGHLSHSTAFCWQVKQSSVVAAATIIAAATDVANFIGQNAVC